MLACAVPNASRNGVPEGAHLKVLSTKEVFKNYSVAPALTLGTDPGQGCAEQIRVGDVLGLPNSPPTSPSVPGSS